MKLIRSLLPLVFFAAALVGCGSSSSDGTDTGTAKVRFVNLAPDASAVDVYIDGELEREAIPYGINDGYHSLDADVHAVRVTIRNTFTNLVDGDFSFDEGQDYTIFVTGRVDNTFGTVFLDDNDRASDDRVKLRIVHGVSESQDIDVYITSPNADIANSTPSLTNLGYRDGSVYLENVAGVYRIRATLSGSQTVVADSGAVSFDSGQVATAMVVESLGGGAPFSVPVFLDRD